MAERSTFAFAPADPYQQNVGGLGGFNSGQVVGGGSRGENLSPAAQAGRADFGAQLGGFVDKLVQPYAERKARQNFIRGMTDQMYREAGNEIKVGNGILPKIFGPTAYEEGAIFYNARERVAQAQQDWAAAEDELKLLSPEEVSKAWAAKLEGTKTGDPFTDDIIEQSLMEASGPMLQSVAKAQYKYKQEQVVLGQQRTWTSEAGAYQAQAESFSNTSEPTEDQILGFNMATRNFLSGMAQPAGQEDESYTKSVSNSFRRMIQDGNGHAASALMRSGVLDILPPEERVRAEDQYNKYAATANGKAASQFIGDIDALEGKLRLGEISGPDAVKQMDVLNERIKRRTGFDHDFFDTTDKEAAIGTVWGLIKSAKDKAEDQAFALEVEGIRAQNEKDLVQFKADQEAAAADLAYNSDSPGSARVAGAVTSDAMQARLYKGYQDNDFAGLGRSYKDGETSTAVTNAINNTINSAVYTGYSEEFEGLAQKFDGMMKVNPAMAKEYFGNQNWWAMNNYIKQKSGGASKQVAFAFAFGDDIQYSPDGRAVSKANKDVVEFVGENGNPGRLSRIFGGEYKLNASGQQELANMIGREVAVDNRFGGAALSNDTLMRTAMERARLNGQFEKAGPLAWSNRPNTTPLYKLLGYTPGTRQEADTIILSTINTQLKKAGFADGAFADEYSIVRSKYKGKETLIVVPVEDGVLMHRKGAVVTIDMLNATKKAMKAKATSPGAMSVRAEANKEWGTKPLSNFMREQLNHRLKAANQSLANGEGDASYHRRRILLLKDRLSRP